MGRAYNRNVWMRSYLKHREERLAGRRLRRHGREERFSEERECVQCGSVFKAKNPQHLYCGKLCSKRAERNRKQDHKTDKRRELKNALKSGGCVLCGYSKCISALEFHHIDTNKEREVGPIRTVGTMLREAAKCIVVCANCHREIHSNMIDGFSNVRTVKQENPKISLVFDSSLEAANG